MGMLLTNRNFNLFNRISDLPRVHRSQIDTWAHYGERRRELACMIPAQVTGTEGVSLLSKEQVERVGPITAELRSMADWLFDNAERQSSKASSVLREYNDALKMIVGRSFVLQDKNPIQTPDLAE